MGLLLERETKIDHKLRLACGHFAEVKMTSLEISKLGEEIEQNNPLGKTGYCEDCKGYRVITCVYN